MTDTQYTNQRSRVACLAVLAAMSLALGLIVLYMGVNVWGLK